MMKIVGDKIIGVGVDNYIDVIWCEECIDIVIWLF